MKDINATLKRLDEEIVGHHQQIARHQVEVMRLQDTRQVLMRLVEDDQHAAETTAMERALAIEAKPVLIVRKVSGSGEDKAKRGVNSASGDFQVKILHLLATTESLTRIEIGDRLGLPRGEKPRKSMSNALYQLTAKGRLARNNNRYSLVG